MFLYTKRLSAYIPGPAKLHFVQHSQEVIGVSGIITTEGARNKYSGQVRTYKYERIRSPLWVSFEADLSLGGNYKANYFLNLWQARISTPS